MLFWLCASLSGRYLNAVASKDKAVSRKAARRWLRFRAKRELQGYIKKDIHRTFGDILFFRRKEVQDMLLRVLQVWALAHPSLSYKQARHGGYQRSCTPFGVCCGVPACGLTCPALACAGYE